MTIVVAGSEIRANVAVLLNDGVRGIISNGTTLKTALHAVRLVQSGGTFVSPELLSNGEHRTEFGEILTQRQIDVVKALRQGKANKEIARDLNLRESTVKVHVRQIMRKLDAKNRTEIAVLANELRRSAGIRTMMNKAECWRSDVVAARHEGVAEGWLKRGQVPVPSSGTKGADLLPFGIGG